LILDLAVRGKLVEQDDNDEPADQALSRILAAKEQRRRTEKKRKKSGSYDEPEPLAWMVPNGWATAPLSDLVTVLNGRAYKKAEFLEQGTPVLRVGNLFTSQHWYYSDLELESDKYCDDGDLIFAWSASFGPFIWSGPRVIYHYHIWKLDLHSHKDLDKNYLYRFLMHKTQAIKKAGHGVSMVHMTKHKMEQIPIPLPPLSEQRRIVSKVNGLMSFCDELESRGTSRVTVRERASRSCLDRLVTSSSRHDLHSAWQRLGDHFEVLYDTPETLEQLRQAVLALSLDGHFTKAVRYPSGSDSELSKSIRNQRRQAWERSEAARLSGNDKAPKHSNWKNKYKEPFSINVAELPPLPDSWYWASIDELTAMVTSGSRGWKEYYADSGSLFIRSQDIKNDYLDLSRPAHVDVPPSTEGARTRVQQGDLLLTITGANVAKTAHVDRPLSEAYVSQHVALIKPVDSRLSPFIHRWLISEHRGRGRLLGRSYGDKPGLNLDNIRTLPIALPPLAEQERIVAKVDQLLLHCDGLAVGLAHRQSTTQQLLTATIHHVLNAATDAGNGAVT
jgi:type I restriction enzyme S subunit